MQALNNVDRVYQHLLNEIMTKGVNKDTRAGKVKSIFAKQLKFDLKEGFPLLTTKKVFTKGIIHELLWFLQRPYNSHGSSNIEYLVNNNVHIWDADAFRWYKEWVTKEIIALNRTYTFLIAVGDDEIGEEVTFKPWDENDDIVKNSVSLLKIEKDRFLDLVKKRVEIRVKQENGNEKAYRYGDLGPIYGKQWRSFDGKNRKVDQIQNIINTLKTNPNDRRMLCVAFNPSALKEMALPPCHVMMQFYTRKLDDNERWEIYSKRLVENNGDEKYKKIYEEAMKPYTPSKYRDELNRELDKEKIPVYGLSCMYTMRSNDIFLGCPFNIASYSFLTYMIAKVVNMMPDTLTASLGDCHIYEAHFEAVEEQLKRKGSDKLPKLIIHGNQLSIDDFKYEDFEFVGYYPDPSIKAPLLVG